MTSVSVSSGALLDISRLKIRTNFFLIHKINFKVGERNPFYYQHKLTWIYSNPFLLDSDRTQIYAISNTFTNRVINIIVYYHIYITSSLFTSTNFPQWALDRLSRQPTRNRLDFRSDSYWNNLSSSQLWTANRSSLCHLARSRAFFLSRNILGRKRSIFRLKFF